MTAPSKKMSAIAVAAIFFLFDRLIKLLFVGYYRNLEFKVIGDWFKLKLAYNSGIAFGLPLGQWLIIAATIIILLVLIYLAIDYYKKEDWNLFTAWVMLIAGACSNLLDRFHYAMVVDYFDLRYFTVFNLADVAITLSIAYLLYKLAFKKSS